MAKNQCDGCNANMPVKLGIHYLDGHPVMGCTRELYEDSNPEKDVHTEHCCALHGCKYGKDGECTVLLDAKKQVYSQSYPCECCNDMGIKHLSEVSLHIHPTKGQFANQIIIYAKNWYGRSNLEGKTHVESILHDLKVLCAEFCWLDYKHISDKDIQRQLASAFSDFVKNPVHKSEAITEMLGWQWGHNNSLLSDRAPEVVMLDKLSIIEAKYVFMPEKIEGIQFGKEVDKS